MSTRLRVNTKGTAEKRPRSSQESEEDKIEPVSPLSECLMSEGLKMANLVILETLDIIDVPSFCALIKDVGLALHPRFSSIPVHDKKGGKIWKKVQVNVEDYIMVPNLPEGLSLETYNKHFNDYLNKVANDDLPADKPLWEIHLFKYPINDAIAGVIIFKVDHAIADGISLMGTVFSLFKRADDPSLPFTFPINFKGLKKNNQNITQTMSKIVNFVPKTISCFFYSLYEFGQSLRLMFTPDDCTPIRSENAGVNPVSIGLCTVPLSLNDVKKIKTILGVSVNDVLFGIVSLGVRLYMQEMKQGKLEKSRSTGVIPINIRSIKGYAYASPEEMRKANTKVPWGNRFSSIEVPILNVDEDDLKNPLLIVNKAHNTIMRKRRATLAHILISGVLAAIKTCGGTQAATRVMQRKWGNSSVAILNMIGPSEQASIANHRINDGYFMTAWKKQTLIVSMGSYMDKLRICLSFEQGFVDQQRLTACVLNAFQMIYQAATATASSA